MLSVEALLQAIRVAQHLEKGHPSCITTNRVWKDRSFIEYGIRILGAYAYPTSSSLRVLKKSANEDIRPHPTPCSIFCSRSCRRLHVTTETLHLRKMTPHGVCGACSFIRTAVFKRQPISLQVQVLLAPRYSAKEFCEMALLFLNIRMSTEVRWLTTQENSFRRLQWFV